MAKKVSMDCIYLSVSAAVNLERYYILFVRVSLDSLVQCSSDSTVDAIL